MFVENFLNNILAGNITSSALQTLLTSDATYRVALQKIYNSHKYSKLLALSNTGMKTVFGSEKAGELFKDNELILLHHINSHNSPYVLEIFKNKNATLSLTKNSLYEQLIKNPVLANLIESEINANPTNFIVKRLQITSSGTWTPPATLSFLAVLCLGAGGNAGVMSGANVYSEGGSGGESKCVVLYDNFPTSPVTVTIGTPNTGNTVQAGSTSFGSICTAVGGFNGGVDFTINNLSHRKGGGTTTNGGRKQLNGTNVDTVIIQNRPFSQQGGNGGGSVSVGSTALQVAGVGLQGTAGVNYGASTSTATAGSPYGNGGGYNAAGGGGSGQDAAANSGSGAGAPSSLNTTRNGGSGKVWLWWIE
jgi:hypothetical protein